MVYWNTKPPEGPFSKTAERVLLVLGIVMTIPLVAIIVMYGIWLFNLIVHWITGR